LSSSIPFSIMVILIYFPTNSPFSPRPWQHLLFFVFFSYSYSNNCEVIAHGFSLYFPIDYWDWAFFHVPTRQFYVFFWEMSFQVLSLLFEQLIYLLLISCLNSLYILNVRLLLDIWFVNIFSHSPGCHFAYPDAFWMQFHLSLLLSLLLLKLSGSYPQNHCFKGNEILEYISPSSLSTAINWCSNLVSSLKNTTK
jgi:hypothetical protein